MMDGIRISIHYNQEIQATTARNLMLEVGYYLQDRGQRFDISTDEDMAEGIVHIDVVDDVDWEYTPIPSM